MWTAPYVLVACPWRYRAARGVYNTIRIIRGVSCNLVDVLEIVSYIRSRFLSFGILTRDVVGSSCVIESLMVLEVVLEAETRGKRDL